MNYPIRKMGWISEQTLHHYVSQKEQESHYKKVQLFQDIDFDLLSQNVMLYLPKRRLSLKLTLVLFEYEALLHWISL